MSKMFSPTTIDGDEEDNHHVNNVNGLKLFSLSDQLTMASLKPPIGTATSMDKGPQRKLVLAKGRLRNSIDNSLR